MSEQTERQFTAEAKEVVRVVVKFRRRWGSVRTEELLATVAEEPRRGETPHPRRLEVLPVPGMR